MRDTYKQLQALDEFSRKQIILDNEFSTIFPEFHNNSIDTKSIEHFKSINGRQLFWDCLLVVYFVLGVGAMYLHYA